MKATKGGVQVVNKPAPPAGKLNTVDLYAISMGAVIGAGVITLIGPAMAATGLSVWLAYATAILLGFFMVFPMIIASTTVRIAGGLYSVCADMSHPRFAGMMSYTYLVTSVSNALFAISLGVYINSLIPALPQRLIAVSMLIIFYVINLFGVSVFARAAKLMTWILFVGLLLFITMGVPQISNPIFSFSSPDFFTGGFKGFFTATFLLIYSTQGYYIAFFYGADAKKATRDIPKAMALCIPSLIILYLGVCFVHEGVLPIPEVINQPLTVTAMAIMPKALYIAFIVGGPIMALTTTLNTGLSSGIYPIRQACLDGWLPRKFASENRFGVSWKILTYMFLLATIPLILNFDITMITNNIQLVYTFINVFTMISIMNMPKKYPDAWAKSKLHMPKGLFMFFIFLSLAINAVIFVKSIFALTAPVAIGNCIVLGGAIVAGFVVSKRGNVRIETSVWTDDGESIEEVVQAL